VITCDDLEICAVAAPPLTTVDIPNHRAGYETVRFIWSQLQKARRAGLSDMLPVENVVVWQSTSAAIKP
jgi:DNA-binding LacI/PurR family transcriptional regulator